jgi:hypothetical protein
MRNTVPQGLGGSLYFCVAGKATGEGLEAWGVAKGLVSFTILLSHGPELLSLL